MDEKPYPFTPEQLAWLIDLETTEEPQTQGSLHRLVSTIERPAGYCPLGRAAVVLGLKESPCSHDEYLGSFHGSSAQLFPFRLLHLRGSSGELRQAVRDPDTGEHWETLAEINDEMGWTFKEIAAYIRAHPWNVFIDPAGKHDADCPHAEPRAVQACNCGFYKRDFSK